MACRKRLRIIRANQGAQIYIQMDAQVEELKIFTGEVLIEVKRSGGNTVTVLCRQERRAKMRLE